MALTISGLASAVVDPQRYEGTPKSNDLDAYPNATDNRGTEIADILIAGLEISVDGAGATNAG